MQKRMNIPSGIHDMCGYGFAKFGKQNLGVPEYRGLHTHPIFVYSPATRAPRKDH